MIAPAPSLLTVTDTVVSSAASLISDFSVTLVTLPFASFFVVVVTATSLLEEFVTVVVSVEVAGFVAAGFSTVPPVEPELVLPEPPEPVLPESPDPLSVPLLISVSCASQVINVLPLSSFARSASLILMALISSNTMLPVTV